MARISFSIFALLASLALLFTVSFAYVEEDDGGKINTPEENEYFAAIDAGDLDAVKEWIAEKDMDVNTRDEDHRNGLQRAIVADQTEVGLWFIDNGVNYVYVDSSLLDPLHLAAKYDRHVLLNRILEMGIHPHKKNKDGMMPLHRAAMGTTPDAAKTMAVIFKFKIDVNARDEKGKTALNHAIKAGNKDSIDFLISKGATMYYLTRKEQKKLHHLAPYIHHEL